MKGAIFVGFSEFVESTYGLTFWLQIIESCSLGSNGEYISTELYDDDEFNVLVKALSQATNKSIEAIKREFGQYIFPSLMSIAKKHIAQINNLVDFLIAVDNLIHIEVQKADPLAYTPKLFCDVPSHDELIIRYVSKRNMCHFAEGLIMGAAGYFDQKVILSQPMCVCKGDKHCLIKVQIIPH